MDPPGLAQPVADKSAAVVIRVVVNTFGRDLIMGALLTLL